MPRLTAITSLCAATAILAGCGAIHNMQQSATGGFHAGFRASFKSSFVKSCTAQPGTTATLCGCVEGMLERKHTDDELMQMTSNVDKTNKELGDAARACAGRPSWASQPQMDPTRVDAYVTPYYDAKGPTMHVGPFSAGLAANDETQVLATIEKMKQRWLQLSFPQLYVGAIRLYDLGYRNEAVYWFYTAQYRGRLVGLLLDPAKTGSIGDPAFELRQANNAFIQTVGVWTNGYAFGHVDDLIGIVHRVQHEGRRIPDLRAVYPHVAFIERNRWQAANAALGDGMDLLVAYLAQHRSEINRQRIGRGTDAKFSHLTSKQLPQASRRA
jgi:hypothetical protein